MCNLVRPSILRFLCSIRSPLHEFYIIISEFSKATLIMMSEINTIFIFFYINRRKYCFRVNFLLPVFDGFTRFGMSWAWFNCFWKTYFCLHVSVCGTVCAWQKFCGKCSSRTNQQNLMKLYLVLSKHNKLMSINC